MSIKTIMEFKFTMAIYWKHRKTEAPDKKPVVKYFILFQIVDSLANIQHSTNILFHKETNK